MQSRFRYFDPIFTYCLVTLGLILFFLPKFNLLQIDARQTAGIRIDDLVLAGVALIILWGRLYLGNQLHKIEKILLVICSFSFFSFFLNQLFLNLGWIHVKSNPLFCLRFLEYFIFFYIGVFTASCFSLSRFLKIFLGINFMAMGLQKMGLIGAVSSTEGYLSVFQSRVVGLASFPAEIAAILNILFCYFLYRLKKRPLRSVFIDHLRALSLFFLFAIPLVFTGSRIGLFTLFVCFLFYFSFRSENKDIKRQVFYIFALIIMMSSFLFLILNNPHLLERSQGLLSLNNFVILQDVWNHVDIDSDYFMLHYRVEGMDHDISWGMRAAKWCYAIKLFWNHPECYLQGLGPGVLLAALDGGFLRIFVEYGLIGFALFMWYFRAVGHVSSEMRWVMIAFYLNMIFFDAYLAYKVMAILFLMTGYHVAQKEKILHSVECSVLNQI